MSDDSITVKILAELRTEVRELRDELRTEVGGLRGQLRTTNLGIDDTNERLEQLRLDVKSQIAAVETHAATRHIEQVAATRDLYDLIKDRFELRDRVERLETDVADLKDRVG